MKQKSKKKKAKGESAGRKPGSTDKKIKPGIPLSKTNNYTVDEITVWLRVPDKQYVLRAIRNGELKASKHSRRYIIYGADALIFNKKRRVYCDK